MIVSISHHTLRPPTPDILKYVQKKIYNLSELEVPKKPLL